MHRRTYSPNSEGGGTQPETPAKQPAASTADGVNANAEQGVSSTPDPLEALKAQYEAERAALDAKLQAVTAELETNRKALLDRDGTHQHAVTTLTAERDGLRAEREANAAKLTEATARLKEFEQREADRIAAVAASNEATIGKLPEAMRDLVPVELKGHPDQLAAWLARAAPKMQVAAGAEVATSANNRQAEATPAERDYATRMGLDPSKPENLAYVRAQWTRINPPTA